MKLQRYYSQGFGESDDGDICWSEDVAYLEAVNAELLEALKAVVPYVLHLPEYATVRRTICSAIAKAEGAKP